MERNGELEYRVIRSKRKTVSLVVEADLQVVVRAPNRMSQARVRQFVQEHREWILRQKKRLEPRYLRRRGFHFGEGQRFPLLGEQRVLEFGDAAKVLLRGEAVVVPRETGDVERALVGFLKEEAKERVGERLGHFAAKMGLAPRSVKITSAKTRWGSCSAGGNLCFSYRVICLPPDLLDYIVVHELAHLVEHNHSWRFYAVVEGVLPDMEGRIARLRAFQEEMVF